MEEVMNVVIVGHVDHGKSTIIGRLLADTDSLPEGKLQMVKDNCKRNSKPFEYAFLLDALKDEQSQGITYYPDYDESPVVTPVPTPTPEPAVDEENVSPKTGAAEVSLPALAIVALAAAALMVRTLRKRAE